MLGYKYGLFRFKADESYYSEAKVHYNLGIVQYFEYLKDLNTIWHFVPVEKAFDCI